MTEVKPMKISEWIKDLQWQLDTYGDADVRVCWERHDQLDANNVFFSRVIGNYECSNTKTDKEIKELKDKPTDNDGLWIQNFPY